MSHLLARSVMSLPPPSLVTGCVRPFGEFADSSGGGDGGVVVRERERESEIARSPRVALIAAWVALACCSIRSEHAHAHARTVRGITLFYVSVRHQAAPFLERDAYLYSGDPEVKLEMIHVCYEKLGIMHPPAPCCGSDRTTRKLCNIDTSDGIMKVTKARRH